MMRNFDNDSEKDLAKEFLSSFTDANGEAKYMNIIQEVANRRIRSVQIDLEVLFNNLFVMAESGKKTRGKQVIELKRIEDDKNRVITFSKRKSGICKKASELATLTGAKVGVVMFSPSGKPYSFGDPSIEDVTNLFQGVSQLSDGSTHHVIAAYRKMKISKLLQDHNEFLHQLDDEKEHGKKLEEMTKGKTSQGWWESPTDDLNVQQLRQMHAAFEKLSKTTHSKINQRNLGGGGASSSSFPAVNPPQTRI